VAEENQPVVFELLDPEDLSFTGYYAELIGR
jgi:hypothetical protein